MPLSACESKLVDVTAILYVICPHWAGGRWGKDICSQKGEERNAPSTVLVAIFLFDASIFHLHIFFNYRMHEMKTAFIMFFVEQRSSSVWIRLLLFFVAHQVIEAQVRYSVPEEMVSGSMIGDLSRDLGLSIGRLRSGRARVASEDGSELVQFQSDKGILLVKKRIDREEICGQTSPCSFSFEIVLENPMELFSVTVEILDINDNSPAFPSKEITVDISESAMVGAQFVLGSAVDPDVGINTLQGYSLKPTTHFSLKEQTHSDGSTHAEMVLDRPLDREHQAEMKLTLTATDGGSPQRTGTVSIRVIIQDANDNAPIFTHSVYKASVSENSPKGALQYLLVIKMREHLAM